MSQNSFESEVKHFLTFVRTLKFEGLALAALMLVLTHEAGKSLWFLVITFVVFDVSMAGYALNKKVGAYTYNFGHSTIAPTILVIIGILTTNTAVQLWGFAWLFHIGIDRSLGYGLKHATSFKHTHLGKIT